MSNKKVKNRIIRMNGHKVIIDWDNLNKVLTHEEKVFMNKMLGKLIEYDEEYLASQKEVL